MNASRTFQPMTAYMKPLFWKRVGTLRHEDVTRGFKCGVNELHRKVHSFIHYSV
jgi:hypothetical protein